MNKTKLLSVFLLSAGLLLSSFLPAIQDTNNNLKAYAAETDLYVGYSGNITE